MSRVALPRASSKAYGYKHTNQEQQASQRDAEAPETAPAHEQQAAAPDAQQLVEVLSEIKRSDLGSVLDSQATNGGDACSTATAGTATLS